MSQTTQTETSREVELRKRLEAIGEPRELGWRNADPAHDYVGQLDLTVADVPFLLCLAREWVERTDWPEDESDMTVFASVHAWRAAAQLRDPRAATALLDMLVVAEECDDDWYLDEYPTAFAWVGKPAIEPLEAYLADPEHLDFPRICVIDGLECIARRHSEEREAIVAILTRQLERFADQPRMVNAYLISSLVALEAREAADLIERAFATDRVDIDAGGNWNYVRRELGVKGRGIVSPYLADKRPFEWMRKAMARAREEAAQPRERLLASDNPRPRGKARKGRNKRKRR